MSMSFGSGRQKTSLPQLRVVFIAMIFGEISFAVVVLFVGGMVEMSDDRLLRWLLPAVLGFLAVGMIGAYPLVRALLVKSAKARYEQAGDSEAAMGSVLQSFATATLIRSAMAESLGLAGLVFLLVTGMKVFWFAPAVSLVLLAAGMPSQGKSDDFVQEVTGSNPYSR